MVWGEQWVRSVIRLRGQRGKEKPVNMQTKAGGEDVDRGGCREKRFCWLKRKKSPREGAGRTGVDEVERGHGRHAQGLGVGDGEVLRVVGASGQEGCEVRDEGGDELVCVVGYGGCWCVLTSAEQTSQRHQPSRCQIRAVSPSRSPPLASRRPLPVEVVPRHAALAAGHVAADDEVRAAVVLADDHVLDGLPGGGLGRTGGGGDREGGSDSDQRGSG